MHRMIEEPRDALSEPCNWFTVRRLEVMGAAAEGSFDPETNDTNFQVELTSNSRPDGGLLLRSCRRPLKHSSPVPYTAKETPVSRFTQFLDIAGRPSRSDASQYLVAAAVAFPTDDLPTIAAAYTPPANKWSAANPWEASSQMQVLLRSCTAAVVFRVKKTSPAWTDFWTKSDSYHSQMARLNQRTVGFAKAGVLLKYWLFGEASGRVMGDSVRLTGHPKVLTEHGLGSVESTVICDSDIQGQENIDVFSWLFEQVNEQPQSLLASVGIHHRIREARLATEQSEPLLYLADYLAGLYQSCPPSLNQLAIDVEQDNKVTVVDYSFDIAYESIFGSTGLGRQLWPAG